MIKQESAEQLESNIGYVSENYTLLEKEPVLYSWQIDHVQPQAWKGGSIGGAVFLVITALAAWDVGSLFSPALIFLFVAVFNVLFCRYLVLANQLYHYSITAKGIYYTQQDNIPDMAYTVARGIGYLVVIVSIFAVSILGPMALVGAGGGVFLSGALRKMRPKVKHFGCLFMNKGTLTLLKKKFAIDILSGSFDDKEWYLNHMQMFCTEENYQIVLKTIYPFLDNYEVKEVDRWRDF